MLFNTLLESVFASVLRAITKKENDSQEADHPGNYEGRHRSTSCAL